MKQQMIKLFDKVIVQPVKTVEKPKEDLSQLDKGKLSAWDLMKMKTDYPNVSQDQALKN